MASPIPTSPNGNRHFMYVSNFLSSCSMASSCLFWCSSLTCHDQMNQSVYSATWFNMVHVSKCVCYWTPIDWFQNPALPPMTVPLLSRISDSLLGQEEVFTLFIDTSHPHYLASMLINPHHLIDASSIAADSPCACWGMTTVPQHATPQPF